MLSLLNHSQNLNLNSSTQCNHNNTIMGTGKKQKLPHHPTNQTTILSTRFCIMVRRDNIYDFVCDGLDSQYANFFSFSQCEEKFWHVRQRKKKQMVYSNISNFGYTLPNFHNYFRITETGKKRTAEHRKQSSSRVSTACIGIFGGIIHTDLLAFIPFIYSQDLFKIASIPNRPKVLLIQKRFLLVLFYDNEFWPIDSANNS